MQLRNRWDNFVNRFKALQGNPHYIAMGMAVGVFVAITPTIPFHMTLAIAMAFIFRGSKPAAVLGCWISNPLTIPFLYMACYKVGMVLLNHQTTEFEIVMSLLHTLEGDIPFSAKCTAILDFLKEEVHVFYAMMIGGFVLGIPSGVASYFITRKLAGRMHAKTGDHPPKNTTTNPPKA